MTDCCWFQPTVSVCFGFRRAYSSLSTSAPATSWAVVHGTEPASPTSCRAIEVLVPLRFPTTGRQSDWPDFTLPPTAPAQSPLLPTGNALLSAHPSVASPSPMRELAQLSTGPRSATKCGAWRSRATACCCMSASARVGCTTSRLPLASSAPFIRFPPASRCGAWARRPTEPSPPTSATTWPSSPPVWLGTQSPSRSELNRAR